MRICPVLVNAFDSIRDLQDTWDRSYLTFKVLLRPVSEATGKASYRIFLISTSSLIWQNIKAQDRSL